MSNMSYCRFQNTKEDFSDCVNALSSDGLEPLSSEEKRAAKRLYQLAKQYVDEYESWTPDEEREEI